MHEETGKNNVRTLNSHRFPTPNKPNCSCPNIGIYTDKIYIDILYLYIYIYRESPVFGPVELWKCNLV